MSILIFGKNGQIGKELVSRLRKNMEVYAFNSKEVNFLDTRNLEKKIDIIKPKIIINAAAYTKVDEAEKNKKEALSKKLENAREKLKEIEKLKVKKDEDLKIAREEERARQRNSQNNYNNSNSYSNSKDDNWSNNIGTVSAGTYEIVRKNYLRLNKL